MWRINEVVSLDGVLLRILYIEEGILFWIDVMDHKGMPVFVSEVELFNLLNLERLKRAEDPYEYLQLEEPELGSVSYRKREQSYEIIKDIISDNQVFDRDVRSKRVKKIVEDGVASKATIYKLIRRYWQRGQCQNALLPDYKNSGAPGKSRNLKHHNKAGRKPLYGTGSGTKIDENIESLFRLIIDRYLMRLDPLSQSEAYDRFFALFFEHYPGVSKENAPTKRQFTYFFKKEYAQKTITKRQNTHSAYLKDFRPLKSTATASTHGPGFRYEIDATIADIYLVSDTDRNLIIVNRPEFFGGIFI